MACSKLLQKLIQNETPNNTHDKNLIDVQCRSKMGEAHFGTKHFGAKHFGAG